MSAVKDVSWVWSSVGLGVGLRRKIIKLSMNCFAGYFCCYWCCYGYYCWYDYYCGLTLSFIFRYECLRGWLDYPGHSFLFKTSRGVPRALRRSITPLLLWIPDWHFSTSPTVVSLDIRLAFLFKTSSWRPSSSQAVYHATTLVDTRLAFLFKSYRGVTWHPAGISLQDLSRRPSSSQAVYHATTHVDTRLAFLFKSYHGVTWHPTSISFPDLSVASLEFSDGIVRFSCRHPLGISFKFYFIVTSTLFTNASAPANNYHSMI
jgi:hypothetical protein